MHRLGFPLERVTQLHADAALLLTGLIVATLFAVRLTDVSPAVRRRSLWLAAAVGVQVGIGYTQYFLDLPPGVVELHVAGDVEWRWPAVGSRGFNQLPLRMLLPADVGNASAPRNVVVAGRCASMTHEGQSAARVSGGCFVMGQAAGTLAALARRRSQSLRAVPVDVVQQALAADGVYLGTASPVG